MPEQQAEYMTCTPLRINAKFLLHRGRRPYMSLSKDGGSSYVAVVRQAHHWVGGLADRSAPTAASTTLFNLLGGLRPARKLPLHCVPPHIVGEPFGIGAKLRAKPRHGKRDLT